MRSLIEYYRRNGIVIDKEAFVELMEVMQRNPVTRLGLLKYFREIGYKTGHRLFEKGGLGVDDPLKETLELCKVSGYIESYEIIEQRNDFASFKVHGAIFGDTFRRKGIRKKKADEPLAKFIEGVYEAISGRKVKVDEQACVANGSPSCVFVLEVGS